MSVNRQQIPTLRCDHNDGNFWSNECFHVAGELNNHFLFGIGSGPMGLGPSSVRFPVKAVRLASRFVEITTISTGHMRTTHSVDRTDQTYIGQNLIQSPMDRLPRLLIFSSLSLFFFRNTESISVRDKNKRRGQREKIHQSAFTYCLLLCREKEDEAGRN